MPTFYNSQNQPLTLGERLGSGGEGTVYSCDDFGLVAKIYHEPITAEKAEKLRWMAANKNEPLLKVAAWVVDVLCDAPDGKVVGFVMPNVKAKEIHELYSLKSRRVYFPEATWQFLVHTGANLARAFHNLHKNAHVMGDVNHGNCVVLADGTVKLIDCDSYSIKTDQIRYRCEVGVATHLAPELQGADLSEVTREDKHDNFGLAVIIFQLLFLGRHPFAGNFLGAEDKSIEDCIRELRFAYGNEAESRKVRQPPGTLSLSAVSPRIALMFERAFLTEDRPEPREWIEALDDLSNNLECCQLHPGHFYFNQLSGCPWCEIESQTGLMLFPFVTNRRNSDGETPFNIFTVENLIASFGIGENLPAKPLLPPALPLPSAEVLEARRESRNRLAICASVQFLGLIALMAAFGAGIAFFIGIVAMIFWLVYWKGSGDYKRDEIIDELSGAQAEWESFEQKWQQTALSQTLDDDLIGIRRKVADYQKFQQERLREANSLQNDLTQRELFRHLRSMPLANAEIEGFAENERQWLVGKGIKTAAEINESRIRALNDFNGAIVPKLLKWRNGIEIKFSAAPRSASFKNEQEEFVRETARERRRIEMEIEHSLAILRSGAVNLRRRQQELSGKTAALGDRFLQAKSNAESVGSNSPAIVVLVLITILTPYFGFIISQINAPSSVVRTDSGNVIVTNNSSALPLKSNGSENVVQSKDLPIPAADITDVEIGDLSVSQRDQYANNLFWQATDLTNSSQPDYPKAEQKMRLALRLSKNETHYFNQLGYTLYKQDKYDESLKYLNQSLKIDGSNTNTKIYIGINYLGMKRLKDAQKIFSEAVKQYPGSFEGNYNLGLAHIGLKQYKSAADVLEKAVEINNDDVDTHYQLAICYHKLSEDELFEGEYEKLLDLDEETADKLANETGFVPPQEVIQSVDPMRPPPPPPPAPKRIKL